MMEHGMKHVVLSVLATLLAVGMPAADSYARPAKHSRASKSARASKPAPAQNGSLIYKKDIKLGKGDEAVAGKTVSVQYTGWLYNRSSRTLRGAQIDSSQGGKPFEFKLGAGQAIKGWDEGVAGMNVGGERIIVVPGLGYGTRVGSVTIPPDTPLLYDITLLGVH
jgi:FKBP-type peptidyl-prolyl cis-trans isomerase